MSEHTQEYLKGIPPVPLQYLEAVLKLAPEVTLGPTTGTTGEVWYQLGRRSLALQLQSINQQRIAAARGEDLSDFTQADDGAIPDGRLE